MLFATSHGKSPYNGVGGFVKQFVMLQNIVYKDPYMTKFGATNECLNNV